MSNHLSGQVVTPRQVSAPSAADSVWAVIAAGTPLVGTEVLPAPPAGKLYFIHRIIIVNNDAALTAGYRVNIGAKPAMGSLLTTSIAASTSASVFYHVANDAVVVFATGLGAITVVVQYSIISSSVGPVQSVALTNAYQAITGIVPAPGFVSAVPLHAAGIGTATGGGTIMNADSASTTVSFEVTRGSDVIVLTQTVAAFTRASTVFPALRNGDAVRSKVAVSPGVAGSVVLWLFYQTLARA